MNAEDARALLREQGYSLSRKAIARFNLEITSDVCLECLRKKPLKQFNRDRTKATGHKRICRNCHRAKIREQNATRQTSLFGDELPEMSQSAVDAIRREWGCMTPQEPKSINAAWKYQMGKRRFDEPGMQIKQGPTQHRHVRLA